MNETKVIKAIDEAQLAAAPPSEVISRAQEMARALMDVVERQKLYQEIAGRKYLQVEAWQLLATFCNLSPVITETKYVELGEARGWEARCEVLNRNGQVVAAGEAMCMSDEPNWAGKPLFQLRSMAQTRAIGKALRTKLSFIVVLAGYEPTPAEEVEGEEVRERQYRTAASFDPDTAFEKTAKRFGLKVLDRAMTALGLKEKPQTREEAVKLWQKCQEIEKQIEAELASIGEG